MNWPVFFFLGGDPAPSETQRSDDGALTVSAAWPRENPVGRDGRVTLPESPAEWWYADIYARVFTSRHRLSASQWSGFIYELDERFGFERVCLDGGAAGGGMYVSREMLNPEQVIHGIKRTVVPIADTVNGPKRLARGRFILNIFKRGDPGVDLVWPDPTNAGKSLAGDELLKDALYATYKKGLDHTEYLFPAPVEEWFGQKGEGLAGDRTAGWDLERKWALKNLEAGVSQLQGITVATTEKDDTVIMQTTRRGARIFHSAGKDDIALSKMYARAAFLIWLAMGNFDVLPEEDAAGFGGA